MARRFNERGEIIREAGTEPTHEGPQRRYGQDRESARDTFQWTTILSSVVVYAIVGLALSGQWSDWEPVVGLLVGGLWGGAGTAIFNATKGREYTGKPTDYVYSIGVPAAAALAVVFSIAILIIWIAIMALSGG